jgi:DNA polymerase-4
MPELTSKLRKIIHCDCDCFYASIEVRDNPQLAGLPIAVGGSPQRRGVVATCNYEAREFGIHSAMASATARKLCPDLVIIKPDMEKYRIASQKMHGIFQQYTDLIEPLSLDEAFLDVTDSDRCDGSATLIASEIRSKIAEEINITVSAGIAPNKFLAKIASDWNKPNGQFVVVPNQIDTFVNQLPVKKLYGVGKVTAARLHAMNIKTCNDLRNFSIEDLTENFGSFGQRLYNLCRGIDNRPVQPSRIRKSISVETTYVNDLPNLEACLNELPLLHKQLLNRMKKIHENYVISKQIVKIKFLDFVSTTVETVSTTTDIPVYQELLRQGFERGKRPVRLLGIGAKLTPRTEAETEFNDSAQNIESEKAANDSQLALGLD